MNSKNDKLRLLLSIGVDYVRWTQLTPMLLVWAFALFMLVFLASLNFQQQAVSAMEYVLGWLMQLPWLGEYVTAVLTREDTNMDLGADDLETFILSAWLVISLVMMLVKMALSAMFGPFEPWSLKRKIICVGIGAIILLTGLVLNYFAGSQNYNGPASGWMLNFSLISLLVFLVSVYSLTISHMLSLLNSALQAPETLEQ